MVTANEVSRDQWLTANRSLLETSVTGGDAVDSTYVKKATKHKRRRVGGSKGKQRKDTGDTNSSTRERKESLTSRGNRGSASSSSRSCQRQIVDLVVETDLDNRKGNRTTQIAHDPEQTP